MNAPHLELRWLPPPRVDKEDNETIVVSNTRPREVLRGIAALNDVSTAPATSPSRNLAIRSDSAGGGNPRPISTHFILQAAPYKLGQTADARDIVRFRTIEQAHETLPQLPIGTPLFVKRSNRKWTYARIVSYRRPDSSEGDNDFGVGDYWNEGKENFIVVVLDEDHSMRKFIGKNKWYSCVRLVRLGTRMDHDTRFVRHKPHPNQHELVRAINRRNSAPHDVSSQSDLVDTSLAAPSAIPRSGVQSHSTRRGFDSEPHNYRQNSKHEFQSDRSAVQSPLDCNRSLSKARHSDKNAEHRSLTIVLSQVALGTPTEDDDSVSVASTTAVERRSFQTEPNSHILAVADSSTSMCFPSTPEDVTDSPSSPNEAAIDLSPAKVNLNARHFCGKRRDRMRPMKRRQSIA